MRWVVKEREKDKEVEREMKVEKREKRREGARERKREKSVCVRERETWRKGRKEVHKAKG